MLKQELRDIYKAKRKKLTKEEVRQQSDSIFNQFEDRFQTANKTVHLFISIEKFNEINTSGLLKKLLKEDTTLCTSITHFNPLRLSHCYIDEQTQYEVDKFGIPTPVNPKEANEKDIDIVLVPLLITDQDGNRVGYGKGLYDSFLVKCRPDCIKIGVSLFEPIEKITDTNPHDIPLDFVITPTRVYKYER